MEHGIFMNRCIELAKLGAGKVAPNPMVGAVLVYEDRIIGEGYHQLFGAAHAEVNCIASVNDTDKTFISKSTLYVSLEPCAHYGKTPPCADLIIANKIPRVVIGCKDPFAKVNGLGIKKLQDAGIEVIENVLHLEAMDLNKRFFCFHKNKRPFIILKWAESADGYIAKKNNEAVAISNSITTHWVHKMRAEEAAIMVGANTALYDNPALTTRKWAGQNPLRITIDKNLELSPTAAIKNNDAPVFIFNQIKSGVEENVHYIRMENSHDVLPQLMDILYEKNIQSLIVEGGTQLLQSFFYKNLWDECFIITNSSMQLHQGVSAPVISVNAVKKQVWNYTTDTIVQYQNQQA